MATIFHNDNLSFDSKTVSKMFSSAKGVALEVSNSFNQMQSMIKRYHQAREDYDRLSADLEPAPDFEDKQNVKRYRTIFLVVLLIATTLSVKGVKFFLSEFYANIPLIIYIPLCLVLAYVIIHGSIYLSRLAGEINRDDKPILYNFCRTTPYILVLFIPFMNLLEGFDSNYRPVVMALNIVGCIVDITMHATLVAMGPKFITIKNTKTKIKNQKKKEKKIVQAEKYMRSLKESFESARSKFANNARAFVLEYFMLNEVNSNASANVLRLLDNFQIWMINNRVIYNNSLPYHGGSDGRPIVDTGGFFNQAQDTVRQVWDNLDKVSMEDTAGDSSGDNTQIHLDEHESDIIPDDYSSQIEIISTEDKIL